MKTMVVVDPAEQDVADIRDFLEVRRQGFGDKFVFEFHKSLKRIEQFPERYELYSRRIRLCPMRRFKAGIYYNVGERFILIIRVIDLRRGRRAVAKALRPW